MEPKKPASPPSAADREARLRAALKANLGRRKAQARARTRTTDAGQAEAEGPGEQKED